MSSLRRLSCLPILALAWACACDGDAKPKAAEAPAAAPEKQAPEVKEEVKEAPPKEAALELPWIREKVAQTMTPGTELVYKLSGVDAKGKKVEDDYRCQVKSNDTRSIGTVCNTVNKPSKDKGATMVATRDVSTFSPFFAVERPQHTLLRRESVTVPAGTFEAVVADLKDFFGADYTIWMIVDKPGIYAKVHEKPRAGDEADKTDKIFELATMTMGQ